MKATKTFLTLNSLIIVVALAMLVAPTGQARAASGVGGSPTSRQYTEIRAANAEAGRQQVTRTQLPLKRNTVSYFWEEAGIAAAVLTGFVVLGLWGDLAIGSLVCGIGALIAGASLIARNADSRVRQAFSGETASCTVTPEAPDASEGFAHR